jgi:hypothetical protein
MAQTTGEEVFSVDVGPVVLANEGPLIPDDYAHDLFTDTGFVIRGNTTSGEEFHIWLFWYQQRGEKEYVVDGDLLQIAVVLGNFTGRERKHMNDVPFINKGQNLEDYKPPGTIQFSHDDKQVTWKFENFSVTTEEGHWAVKGSYADVELDLHITPRGEEFYHAGPFEKLSGCTSNTTSSNYNCSGIAGGINHLYTSGTINYNGTALTIGQAQGVHERIIQAYNVPPRLDTGVGRGSFWLHGWGEQFSWFTFTSDQGYAVGMLNIGNESHATSGPLNVTIEARDHWLDPQTDQVNPSGWYTRAILEEGIFEAEVQAFGRLHYYWLRNGGLMVVNQLTADMAMTYTPHGGEPVTDKGGAFMEVMKNLYLQPR